MLAFSFLVFFFFFAVKDPLVIPFLLEKHFLNLRRFSYSLHTLPENNKNSYITTFRSNEKV